MRKDDKIIGIPYVEFCLQSVFYKLVKLIHVDIDEQLRREIPEWQTFADTSNSAGRHSLMCLAGTEAAYNFGDESHDSFVGNITYNDINENLLIDRSEKLPDVALEYPALPMLCSNAASKRSKTIYRAVDSLPLST